MYQAACVCGGRSKNKPTWSASYSCTRPGGKVGGNGEALPPIVEKYPTLFRRLGSLGEPYDIQLKPDAQPYALFTSTNIPLPLRSKVEQELKQMESLGIISKVDKPTPWCTGMVVVHKKKGAIRICVEYQPLNRYMCPEVYPLPKVDETLVQLAGAKVFSKLDANSGFWQIGPNF